MNPPRPGFVEWIDSVPDPGWRILPLTHVTKGLAAEDIIRTGIIRAQQCDVLKSMRAFLFYGRPSYRFKEDGPIKAEAACPFCFVFDSSLIQTATDIYAFDTGAFAARLYKHIIMDEMELSDFSLHSDASRVNRLIARAFKSQDGYLNPRQSEIIDAEIGASPWEFHARAYLNLIRSGGRNEPDDRISTVEVSFDRDLPLVPSLRGLVVPHTVWSPGSRAPWIGMLASSSPVEISTYTFLPGRSVDYYYALVEAEVRLMFKGWGLI